jgi:hypothetical protein
MSDYASGKVPYEPVMRHHSNRAFFNKGGGGLKYHKARMGMSGRTVEEK